MPVISSLKRWLPMMVIIVLCLFFFFKEDEPVEDLDESENEVYVSLQEEGQESTFSRDNPVDVVVDVKGEVKKPGVYSVSESERVHKVIELAGGFTDEAQEGAVNLAQKVQDEMVIYVPKKGEEGFEQVGLVASSMGEETDRGPLVRVNVASLDELTSLQGIGPAKAQAIIDYREEHGPFQTVEDLLEVSGIGEKTLENIKDSIIIP